MKIANYVLLGLLSCVEVLAEETTAFIPQRLAGVPANLLPT